MTDLQPRGRANSYTSTTGQPSELGPLARIPSPDPDHIDGLHRHGSHSSSHSHTSVTSGPAPSLPPFSFDSSSDFTLDSPRRLSAELTHNNHHHHNTHPEKSLFNHPTLNSSAPALSTMISTMTPPSLPHRSATAPAKKLTFANNLSVYDTFSSTIYDRRSEPATWSRLTPALAQQIKEELNSYKMEEMEVHAASRIQCVSVRRPRRSADRSLQHPILRLIFSLFFGTQAHAHTHIHLKFVPPPPHIYDATCLLLHAPVDSHVGSSYRMSPPLYPCTVLRCGSPSFLPAF
jgi:hypothetical protein